MVYREYSCVPAEFLSTAEKFSGSAIPCFSWLTATRMKDTAFELHLLVELLPASRLSGYSSR
jgi:hypothetical protein